MACFFVKVSSYCRISHRCPMGSANWAILRDTCLYYLFSKYLSQLLYCIFSDIYRKIVGKYTISYFFNLHEALFSSNLINKAGKEFNYFNSNMYFLCKAYLIWKIWDKQCIVFITFEVRSFRILALPTHSIKPEIPLKNFNNCPPPPRPNLSNWAKISRQVERIWVLVRGDPLHPPIRENPITECLHKGWNQLSKNLPSGGRDMGLG